MCREDGGRALRRKPQKQSGSREKQRAEGKSELGTNRDPWT